MKVAVAILIDEQQRVLITQRPLHVSHGGFWEFPGGKLEQDERAEDALIREVKEEIGVDIQEYTYIGVVHHSYPEKSVELLVFLVPKFSGTPSCKEAQLDMKWISHGDLTIDDFPEANHKVIRLLRNFQIHNLISEEL